ncbi:MAG: penicillin acylase family protein [Saprospiraceae bacterium]|nr:penicillin acylase family protein [Saprospiraceae bacterium]
MKWIKLIISILLLCAYVYVMNISLHVKDKTLPPLGNFFSPFTGFWQNAEPIKLTDCSISIPQMKSSSEIIIDKRGVPHIFAKDDKELAFLQGFIHAKDRLCQMDISTRATSGRLSEIVGDKALERDKTQRRKGMVFAAENAVNSWKENPENFAILQSYCDGVNAYISTLKPKDYPLEFKLLGYAPEKWTPLHTALFSKAMAETLSFREFDVENTNTKKWLGDDLYEFLFPLNNPKQTPIIPSGTTWNFKAIKAADVKVEAEEKLSDVDHFYTPRLLTKPEENIGSNNWAVSGTKTLSGKPILCNDPHLNLTLPSIWYEIHLNSPNLNAYGVSIPGIPFILIGFNDNIAWGETNTQFDVLDWYKISWANKDKSQYLINGQPKKVNKIIEVIKVKGKEEPVRDTVSYTEWGPIVYNDENHQDLAMRWLGHDKAPADEMFTFYKLCKSKNYDDYRSALKNYQCPSQNFVFASTDGDIGITVNGKIPIRTQNQGRYVLDGSDANNSWHGFVPMDQVPAVKNPSRGYVASANQNSTDPTYPYFYMGDFDDFRGRYLNRRLTEMDSITVKDMMSLQNDNYSIMAEEGLASLLSLVDTVLLSADEKIMFSKMKKWNYRFDSNILEPIYFVNWFEEAYNMTFDEWDTEKNKDVLRKPENWRFIALLNDSKKHIIFDIKSTQTIESAREVALQSFKKIVKELPVKLVASNCKNWSEYKKTVIEHSGKIEAFSRKISNGGYGQSLNAMKEHHGPSWRMIVDMSSPVKAYAVYPGGESGNPGSPWFDNMVGDWESGKYQELIFVKDKENLKNTTLYKIKIN